MTQYKITHATTYTYEESVRVCHNLVWLTPREDAFVRCRSHRLVVRPTPSSSVRRRDFFGNWFHAFSIEESHRQLVVTATSRVTVLPRELPVDDRTPAWEKVVQEVQSGLDAQWVEASPFRFDSRRVHRSADFRDYAQPSFPAGRPILAGLRDLTSRIHRDFVYDTEATHVHTHAKDAFAGRRGVCQDLAHVQIGCLRSLGIPARYVSGYLRTLPPPGKPRLVGADQSHAWLACYTGPTGWVDVDPTNDSVCASDHVPIAWGRDYADVMPMRGVFLGGGRHGLAVSVDVAPLDEEPAATTG